MTCANCETFQISFYNANLERLITTTNITSARWSRTVNKVGKAILEIPARNTGLSYEFLTQQDLGMTIEISDSPNKPVELEQNSYWFLVKFREYFTKGDCYFRLTFEDSLSLLDRRIISSRFDNTRDGSSKTLLLGMAGNEMVRVVDNFMGKNSPNDLTLFPRLDTTPPNYTSPVIEKNIAFRRLLGVLQQAANASKTNGVPLYFDLVPVIRDGKADFDFRVFKNQLGRDQTAEAINTDHPHFLLEYFEIDFDEPNVGYVSGGGRAEDRPVAIAIAPEASSSPFSRRETFKFSTAYSARVLQTEADNLIADSSGTRKIKGQFVGSLYHKFKFGDTLTLIHRNNLLNVFVKSAGGTFSNQVLDRNSTLVSL